MSIWFFLCISVGIFFVFRFFKKLNTCFAFRELMLLLYAVNYLISPSIIYLLPKDKVFYAMRVNEDVYYPIALSGMAGLTLGLYIFKKRLFNPNMQLLKVESILNEVVLKQWLFGGILIGVVSSYLPAEIGFLIYLLSLIRFVGAFGLFMLDHKKYWWAIALVLANEVIGSLKYGMFHDMVMWMIFFALLLSYYFKFNSIFKIALLILGLVGYNILQNSKSSYREALSNSGGGLGTFLEVAKKTTVEEDKESVFWQSEGFIGLVTRVNQAWILASTVDNMERTQEFQGMENVILYLESAFLPRVLAPNKLNSGDKRIFNRFSGNSINDGTSMGLGIFADGYIAYGFWGVPLFGFALGLIFSIVFNVVYNWTRISPFYFLFALPILIYAIRPDCELQTIMGHIVKSVFVYSLIVRYYKEYFKRKSLVISELINRGLLKL